MSRAMKLGVALLLVYWAWGSSYLAILIGVRDAPPMLFAATRLLLACPLLLLLAWWLGARWPQRAADWTVVAVAALLIPAGAGGLVAWALQTVPSSQAAVIMASSALWMAVMGSWGPDGNALNFRMLVFLVLGLLGVAAVVSMPVDAITVTDAAPYAPGHFALMVASMSLAGGMVLLKRCAPDCGPFMSAGVQAGVGGLALAGVALVLGEWPGEWPLAQASAWALLYLVLVGSVIGYAALFWLVDTVKPVLLGTYLYVSPAVAVLLGAAVLNEQLTQVQAAGCAFILVSIVAVQRLSASPAPTPGNR